MVNEPKTYAAPWDGRIILACRKCQKKLKGHPHLGALAKLKRAIKQRNMKHPAQTLHVINVACMDLCPKDGVTVCDPAQLPLRLSILRSTEDLESILQTEPGRNRLAG